MRPALVALTLLALVAAPASAQSPAVASIASVQSQILELQEQLRQATGRIEQLEFENQRVADRLDRLVGDLDRRFMALEANGTTAPAEVADDARRSEETLPVVTPDAPTSRESVARTATTVAAAGDASAASVDNGLGAPPKTLGTIPRDALLGIEHPDAAAVADPSSVPTAALQGSQSDRLNAAMKLVQRGDLAGAEAAFTRFEQDFPDSPDAPVAAYWVGETYYSRADYAQAAATFARSYRQYGAAARRAPDSLLKLGMSLAALGDKDKACASFGELERRFPDAGVPIRQALARERIATGCS